jgi:hypothetical protein
MNKNKNLRERDGSKYLNKNLKFNSMEYQNKRFDYSVFLDIAQSK